MIAELLVLNEMDNVAIACRDLPAGHEARVAGTRIVLQDDIRAGHKVALCPITANDHVFKYGERIGRARRNLGQGEWVHSHNISTLLGTEVEYTYRPTERTFLNVPLSSRRRTFMGYRRSNGSVGVRNELWIIPSVGCVNGVAHAIAKEIEKRYGSAFDGSRVCAHPFGCSQLGSDLSDTSRILSRLACHPNAGGVIVLGLGCENNQVAALKQAIEKERDLSRVHVYSAQVVDDEVNVGLRAAESLVPQLQTDERVPIDTAELMLAMKCGGSDGFSGITANPLVGRISDLVTAAGGTSILSEVPEMFGAEQYLLNRAIDKQVFSRLKGTIEAFKHYYSENGFPIYENPSPGNKDGGITTLEEKSLGAISKGGTAQITEVRKYGERVTAKGLAIVEAPGNDAVSCTAQVAAGAHMILFTTGRGTPLGFPVPTVKIATNSVLATRKQRWIDFDAGSVMHQSADWEAVTSQLWQLVLDVASGTRRTKNELSGFHEIAIWKRGVTL